MSMVRQGPDRNMRHTAKLLLVLLSIASLTAGGEVRLVDAVKAGDAVAIRALLAALGASDFNCSIRALFSSIAAWEVCTSAWLAAY